MRSSAAAASSTSGSAGKTVSGQAHCPHRHPATGSFVHSHSVLRSAAATRVLHLSVMGSLSDGGCTDAPSMLAGIGFRRSSSITILALRKPDAHRRCSATPDGSPWHTRCLRSACPPSSFTAKPSALADARGYRCCELWAHSCRCRRSALYLPPLHRPSTSPEQKNPYICRCFFLNISLN